MEQQHNDDKEIDLFELLTALWGVRWRIIKYGVVAGVVGIIVALSIPNLYRAEARAVPELETEGRNVGSINSLAAFAGVKLGGEPIGITASTYPQIVSSTPFIFEFAAMPVLLHEADGVREVSLIEYFTEEYRTPWWSVVVALPMRAVRGVVNLFNREELPPPHDINDIDIKMLTPAQNLYKSRFREHIYISIDNKSLSITLTVNTQSPEVSLALADAVLAKLQEYMTLYKTSKTNNELISNRKMLEQAQGNYYAADSIYAAESDRAKNVTSQVARISLDRLLNERNMTYQIYNHLASQVELNKTKLNAETPILTTIEPATLPLSASEPNRMQIVFLFGFIGGVVAASPTIIKQIRENNNESI